MANTENECKDLEIKNYYEESTTHFADMMEHKKEMQEKTYNIKFDGMSIRQIMDFWHINNHAMIDEIHEMTDALGGIKDGDGNAVWKNWKSAYKKYENIKVSDLSENDKKELFMEWVDIWHFLMNAAASIGLDAKTAYNYYFAKAQANKDRQKNGY